MCSGSEYMVYDKRRETAEENIAQEEKIKEILYNFQFDEKVYRCRLGVGVCGLHNKSMECWYYAYWSTFFTVM